MPSFGGPTSCMTADIRAFPLPKVYVQTSFFARGRSPRYFHEPGKFRPQRYLPPDHRLFDTRFAHDSTEDLNHFSLGPRACIAQTSAWAELNLIVAKIFWSFDMTKVPGQDVDLDRDLVQGGLWTRPDLRVRFSEAKRA